MARRLHFERHENDCSPPIKRGSRRHAMMETYTTCPYCGVGCQTSVHVKDDKILYVDGRDGPCHTPELRLRFWNEVLASLDLSPEIIHDFAKTHHGKYSSPEKWAEIERRFAAWTQRQSSSAGE